MWRAVVILPGGRLARQAARPRRLRGALRSHRRLIAPSALTTRWAQFDGSGWRRVNQNGEGEDSVKDYWDQGAIVATTRPRASAASVRKFITCWT